MSTSTKQFTLRLPPDLYARSARIASRHRISLNELARRGLEKLAAEESFAELKAGYDMLGTDSDAANVESFLPAFTEVIRGND